MKTVNPDAIAQLECTAESAGDVESLLVSLKEHIQLLPDAVQKSVAEHYLVEVENQLIDIQLGLGELLDFLTPSAVD